MNVLFHLFGKMFVETGIDAAKGDIVQLNLF